MSLLVIKNLKKSFSSYAKNIDVLKGINLEVKEGESVAILGQSGSGKTTLLSLLAGLDRPSEGDIFFDSQSLAQLDHHGLTRLRAKNIGVIFQQFHLLSHLTALENVCLPLELAHDKQAKEKAMKILENFGLGHRLDHLPAQLSGGEKQRVAIARSFIIKPKLLLADEPSGSLDEETGDRVMDLIFKESKSRQCSLLLVTHNKELAALCDRQVHLHKGIFE